MQTRGALRVMPPGKASATSPVPCAECQAADRFMTRAYSAARRVSAMSHEYSSSINERPCLPSIAARCRISQQRPRRPCERLAGRRRRAGASRRARRFPRSRASSRPSPCPSRGPRRPSAACRRPSGSGRRRPRPRRGSGRTSGDLAGDLDRRAARGAARSRGSPRPTIASRASGRVRSDARPDLVDEPVGRVEVRAVVEQAVEDQPCPAGPGSRRAGSARGRRRSARPRSACRARGRGRAAPRAAR